MIFQRSNLLFKIILIISLNLSSQNIEWDHIIEKFYLNKDSGEFKPICTGASNENYLFKLGMEDFIIRRPPGIRAPFYSSKKIELETLKKLESLSIAPKVYFFDEKQNILVIEYIKHEEIQIDLNRPQVRKQIFTCLHKIENSFLKISRNFDLYNDTLEMVSKLENDSFKLPVVFHSILLPELKKISTYLSKLPRNSICHLDLHSENIIKNKQQYWIIDWEYAAMGHPYITLASMAAIERWDDNEMIKMLKDYENTITNEDFYILYLYRIGLDIFWYVWNQSQQLYSPIKKPYGIWKESYFNSSLNRINSDRYKEAIKHMEDIFIFCL